MAFFIGFAQRDITPAVGGNLYGYHDKIFSTAVNDPLHTTAMCFSDTKQKVLLISNDVCLIQNALSDSIRRQISERENIPFENILLHATHTHTGPNTAGEEGWGKIDTAYCENIFIPKILEAATEACSNLQPAKMGYAATDSFVGINRRQLRTDGNVDLGQNPWGTFDPTMTVVQFATPDRKPLLNFIHYGAHNTACGADTLISRDWSGVAIDRLAVESGAMTCYVNGCEGDTGPRLPNGHTVGNTQYAMELGGLAALDAVRCAKQIRVFSEPDLTVHTATVKLPLKERISREEAQKGYDTYKHFEINIDRQTAHYYEKVLAAWKNNVAQQTEREVPITLVQLGNLVIIPFAYEMFTEISLRIKAAFPDKHILCMSNTGGNNSYFPSADQIIRGGYEIKMFRTGNGTQSPVDHADDYLVQAIVKEMEAL